MWADNWQRQNRTKKVNGNMQTNYNSKMAPMQGFQLYSDLLVTSPKFIYHVSIMSTRLLFQRQFTYMLLTVFKASSSLSTCAEDSTLGQRCLTSATSGWTKPSFPFKTATKCVATHLAFAMNYMKEWRWCWWHIRHERIQFFALSQVPTPLCWSHVLSMPLPHHNLKVCSQAALFCRCFRLW